MRYFGSDVPLLHVYGQFMWHDAATLRGNKEALIALRDALSSAIESGTATVSVFAADGEGYEIEISRVNTMKALGTPEYIWLKERDLSLAAAERDKEFRLGSAK